MRVSHAYGTLSVTQTFQVWPFAPLPWPLSPLNLTPMKFAICNEIFKGWNLDDTLAYVKRLGYSALEIAPFTLANSVTDISTSERQKIRDSAARIGIQIAGIH